MQNNVVFITCHDLGCHLSTYGHTTVHNPALTSLAARGVQFENSFSTAPQCSPSRAALHTGRHAHSVGMLGLAHDPFNWRLHPNEKHMAQYFKEAGYDTALWGVQHVTKTRTVADLGYAFYDASEPVVPAPELAAKAEAFLADPRRKQQPFYMEVGFFEPHRPYDWGGSTPDDSLGIGLPSYLPDSEESRREFAALQGMIRRMDDAIGKIDKALQDHDLRDQTWIIFTTDHGLAMPRAKCTLYDPGIETALIMSAPMLGISGGRRFAELISNVDILPTLLEGLGLTVPDHLHGSSFWNLLTGDAYRPNREVYATKTYHTSYEPMRCIRTETHKLILNLEIDTRINVPDDIRGGLVYPQMIGDLIGQRDQLELYDLVADPDERHNLAHDPDLQPLLRDLKRQLLDWMQATQDPLLEGAVASPYHTRAIDLLTSN